MPWKEDEGGVEEGEEREEEEEEGKRPAATQQIPAHVPSAISGRLKTLRLRICTINAQAVRIKEKYLPPFMWLCRTNGCTIELPCSEEALATLKHFKNQYNKVYKRVQAEAPIA